MMTTFSPEQQAEVDRIVGERLARDRQTRVVSEPRTYGLHSPHSFYSDCAVRRCEDLLGHRAAVERLARYGRELGHEIDQRSREGVRAERILRARERTGDESEHRARTSKLLAELRGFGTDGGISAAAASEAASFVSPAVLLAEWAPFRGAQRVFADACRSLPLPAFGMKLYVPYVSGTDAVGEQTEGGAVAETEPTTALEASPTVGTVTGQITTSMQLHDRGGSGGGSLDAILGGQLHEQLDEAVDKYALNQAIQTGTAIAGNSGAYSNEKYLEDLAKTRKEIADVAGTRLRATHIFSSTDFYGFYTRQFDKNERPFMTPHFVPGFPVSTGADDFDSGAAPAWSRFLGTVMPGGLVWMADDSIPLVGTTTGIRILVSAPATAILLFEDDPVLTTFVETKADTLRVILNLRCYVATVTRQSAGTAVLTGAAYTTAKV
jgi:hypothetical protein